MTNCPNCPVYMRLKTPEPDEKLNEDIEEVTKVASEILSNLVSVDVMRCKDCKYLKKWRTPEQVYDCELDVITCPSPDDYCSKAEKVERHSNNNHWCNTCEFKHLESECLGCAEYDEYDNLIDLHNYKKEEKDGRQHKMFLLEDLP